MTNAQYVGHDWHPKFMDYLHLSFTTATAFSPTDISAIRPWAKLMMMAEEAISLVAKALGFARVTDELRQALSEAIGQAIRRDIITHQGVNLKTIA